MDEPGCLAVWTAGFSPRSTVFSMVLPMATTKPLELSTTLMADISRCPVREDTWSRLARLLNTVSTAFWISGS